MGMGGRNPGVAKLSRVADKLVGRSSSKIAKKLLDSGLEGHITSTQYLVSLAEGADWTEDAALTECVVSLAEKLAAEPEFTGDERQAMVEAHVGGPEPKH